MDFDKTLADLLNSKSPKPFIRMPATGGSNGSDAGKGAFVGKFSPTFLRVHEKQKTMGIEIPLNRRRPVLARTDAENNYLQRADNQGTL